MIYKNKNILPFLLRIPETLNHEEKAIIEQFYHNQNITLTKEIILNENIVPFASCIFIHLKFDQSFWKRELHYYTKRNELIKNSLESIFLTAKKLKIYSITLTENFASVLLSRSPLGCFTSGDVDLSADINEKDKIVSCMESNGFFISNRKKSANIKDFQCTTFFNDSITDSGFWINVLWVTVTRSFLNQRKFNKRLFLKRRNAIVIKNSNIRVLETTSLFYFCAIHIAAGHYYTLPPAEKLYVDLDRLINNCIIDWDLVLSWAKEDNSEIRISVVLYLCYKTLNSKIPNGILDKFAKNSLELKSYLYDEESMKFQKNESKFSRLYIELASRNVFFRIISKIIRIFI